MNLPYSFRKTIYGVYGEKGHRWLEALPNLLEIAKLQWGLSNIQIAPQLSYNYVAFALQGKRNVVLKISMPHKELSSEIAALKFFNGEGTVLLLENDFKQGMMLLERLTPGTMLSTVQNDEEATHIAIDVMLKLKKPCPTTDDFVPLSDWFKGFERLRTRFCGGTGPLDKKVVEEAEGAVKEFLTEDHSPQLMHGDLHHYNILSSEKGWLAIDPKGVIGPPCYEVGPFLLNPRDKSSEEIGRLASRRIAILSERLGFEKERIRKWAIAHAVLSGWWALEDNTGWEYAMTFAKIISSLSDQ